MDSLGNSVSEGENREVRENSDAENCSSGSGNRLAMETDIPVAESTNEYSSSIVPYNRQSIPWVHQQRNPGFWARFIVYVLNIFRPQSNAGAASSSNYEHQSESQDLRSDSNLKTLEELLCQFGKPTLLGELEKSLEDVKRNKRSAEVHNQLVRREDKELQKMSLKFHPDHAGKASNLDAVKAHELQSALNATRTVLKILTQSFLESISFDYRYEYFSKLDITLWANEDEIQKRIQAVLYKICVLSEIKRMNIVGEIRKFLVECQNTVKSYLDKNRLEFARYRNHALYHLQKNIEGYKKFEEECMALIEECSAENDKNMGSILLSMMHKTQNEACILSALERVAKCSFRGKFKIFPVHNTMDEYYILPFVNYVNVLSVCNLLILSKSCSCIFFFFHGSLSCGHVCPLFNKAYNLAFNIYHKKYYSAMDNFDSYTIPKTTKAKADLSAILKDDIFEILEDDFKLDHYKEGKSNKTEMYEELLSLKKVMEDFEENEKAFSELLSGSETDREQNCNNQKMKISDTDIKCSINYDENVSEKFATPDQNFGSDATDDFTNHGNLSQGNGGVSILKRKENEAKLGEESSQSKYKEQLSENLGLEHKMDVGTSANYKINYLYDRGTGKNDFTNHGNLSQGNGEDSIFKRKENEAKFQEESSHSYKCMEQLSEDLGLEHKMDVGTSANYKIN